MIEIVGGSLLIFLLLGILVQKSIYKLWDERACPSYEVEYTKKLTVPNDLEEIRFLILGDVGSGSEAQKQVSASSFKTCQEKGCDFVVLAGDNFIQYGVTCTDDEQWITKFETMYDHDLPFYAILGNHDLKGNWRAQIDYSKVSERWNMPSADYSFTVGPVVFNAINTTCSVKSFQNLFNKTESPWRIALGHHPVVSSGRHGGMTWLEQYLVSKSGIDFFISGHNHLLEHNALENYDQIVSGGGGSPIKHSTKEKLPTTLYFNEIHGYIWAKIDSKRASFHYFDLNGKEIYNFARSKE